MTKALVTIDQGKSTAIGFTSNFDTQNNMSECGVGALIPWADRLYYSTYLAMPGDGAGTRIGYIDRNWADHTVLTTDSIHAARFIHHETEQLCLGCCIIETDGTVHTISTLVNVRVTGFCRHLVTPTTNVYAITMEGKLYDVDLVAYTATQIMDVKTKLSQTLVHYKACWTYAAPFASISRVLMASNVQSNATAANSGALVAVDPVGDTASVKLQESCIEVCGQTYPSNGGATFVIGKDARSPFLGVMMSNNTTVYKYRLPQWTKAQDWYITQEWMRIRPVTTERFVMNAFGTWYNVSSWLAHSGATGTPETFGTPGTDYPIVEPISRYVDTVTDFCVFNGKFAIGTNNMSPQNGSFPNAGQPTSAIKFGDIEDLWDGGKPIGKGYFWYKNSVTDGTSSDPMLIRGYDKKSVQVYNGSDSSITMTISIVDYSDTYTLTTLVVDAGAFGTYQFPDGCGGDWVKLTPSATLTPITAWLECL